MQKRSFLVSSMRLESCDTEGGPPPSSTNHPVVTGRSQSSAVKFQFNLWKNWVRTTWLSSFTLVIKSNGDYSLVWYASIESRKSFASRPWKSWEPTGLHFFYNLSNWGFRWSSQSPYPYLLSNESFYVSCRLTGLRSFTRSYPQWSSFLSTPTGYGPLLAFRQLQDIDVEILYFESSMPLFLFRTPAINPNDKCDDTSHEDHRRREDDFEILSDLLALNFLRI
jgi:hypothetical protein